MHGPPLRTILLWVLDAWRELDRDIVIKSFRCCALSNAVDGTEDNEITCFGPGKQLESGKEHLENNPFALDDSDVEENPGLVIDESDEGMRTLKLINVTVYVNVIFM